MNNTKRIAENIQTIFNAGSIAHETVEVAAGLIEIRVDGFIIVVDADETGVWDTTEMDYAAIGAEATIEWAKRFWMA